MAEPRRWYLLSYDIRDAGRWRRVYRLLRGYGERVQYSVFRCRLSERQLQHLRWQLEQRLESEDSLLVVGLCSPCAARVAARNRPEDWAEEPTTFRVV